MDLLTLRFRDPVEDIVYGSDARCLFDGWFICIYFLQASQFLRIITFYSTQLPGPNYHCREVDSFA